MSETKNLMIPITATAIELYEGDALSAILDKIEVKARELVPDVTTKKGREAIRSNAANVTSSRTYLFKLGKDLTEEKRLSIAKTNDVRNKMEERLKDLNTEVRKPLTEWEDGKKAIEENANRMIALIKDYAFAPLEDDSATLSDKLKQLKAIKIDDSFGDMANVASIEKEKSVEKLEAQIVTVKQREADAAELEQMRKEKEEREAKEESERLEKEQADRDEKIRLEAAENAKREAAEREETLKREKAEAEQREKDAKEKAIRDAKEAEERAEHEKQKAIDAERDRVDAEKKAEREAEEKREANKKHNAKINNAVVSGIIQASGIKEEDAKAIVAAIAKGEIPHVGIRY